MKLSLALKKNTKQQHQELEKVLVKRLKSIRTEADYIDILLRFYGFIRPWEASIGNNIDTALLPDFPERRKIGWLIEDLRHFDATEEVAICEDLPLIGNKYQALGSLYVMEGSTLGGQIISDMVSRMLNMEGSQGMVFFKAYGDQTLPMWSRFQHCLDVQVWDDSSRELAEEAAGQTFIKFKNWLT